MAGFNSIYISVVTLMPNLLFLVVKFFLHRVKHVMLDHNLTLEALALLILQWCNDLCWSDLLVKIFPVPLHCFVTGLSLFINCLLYSLMVLNLCFKGKEVGERELYLTFCFASDPPIACGQAEWWLWKQCLLNSSQGKKNPTGLVTPFWSSTYCNSLQVRVY